MSHKPEVLPAASVTVTCAASGPEVRYFDSLSPCATVADLEEFCRAIREQGGPSDTPVFNAVDLKATINRKVAPL